MALPGNQNQIVPTFTGMSAGTETIVRNILNHASGVITGMILIWLATHGFSEKAAMAMGFSMSEVIGGLVASILTGGVSILWGLWQQRRGERALVNNTMMVAATGQVPELIARKASPEQIEAVNQSRLASIAPVPPAPPTK